MEKLQIQSSKLKGMAKPEGQMHRTAHFIALPFPILSIGASLQL